MRVLDFFYIFIVALLSCQILVPVVSRLSIVVGGVDVPDERKIHTDAIPRLGGIAIFCSLLLTTLILVPMNELVRGLLVGGCVIFLTGLVDDIAGLTPVQKLSGEFLAALLFILITNMKLTSLGSFPGIGKIQLEMFAVPFTIFAMVGLMNAINLLDGLDGLAGGVSVLACITFAILGYKIGNMNFVMLCAALCGSVIGFLTFNTHPARIFMGDSGSLLLGYVLGVMSIVLLETGKNLVSTMTPLLILSVPIFDTLIVMGRRFLRSAAIMQPDRSHFHHQLMGIGLSHRSAVLVVYVLSYFSCMLALLIYNRADYLLLVAIAASILMVYPGLRVYSWLVGAYRTSYSLQHSKVARTRRILCITPTLLTATKYLLIAILLSATCCAPLAPPQTLISWGLIVIIITLLMAPLRYKNKLLLVVLYMSAIFIVWRLVQNNNTLQFVGLSCESIQNGLFICLFLAEGLKAAFRRRIAKMLHTPFEYLLFFIALSVSLLPETVRIEHQLGSIAARCIVMFVAYKLVLIKDTPVNHMIILATLIALLPW